MMNFVVVFREFEYFPSDMTIDVLRGFPILEVLVIRIDLNLVGGVRQQPPPILECTYDGVELQSVDIIVSFGFI